MNTFIKAKLMCAALAALLVVASGYVTYESAVGLTSLAAAPPDGSILLLKSTASLFTMSAGILGMGIGGFIWFCQLVFPD